MSVASFDARQLSVLRRRLLTWFDRHRRDLPWRRDRDPYRIWVSEVMLQQTTVATVSSRFEKFIQIFPTVHVLAEADEQQVLRSWEGLGYYRRARHLHRAARLLIEQHDGRLRDAPAVWEQLPGVGRYILGAVLSQAFDRRLPIVEANSLRVLCRLCGQLKSPASNEAKKWLWQTAELLLPAKRAGDFNQAMMELGALCCTPVDPKCGECPIRNFCISHRDGLQDRIPTRSVAPKIEQVREVALVIRRGTKVLLVQRPDGGRWSNMWELPHIELDSGETIEIAAKRLLDNLGISANLGQEMMTIRHAVTRYRITMACLETTYRSGSLAKTSYRDARWLEPRELTGYPVSTPQRKLANELVRSSRQLRLF